MGVASSTPLYVILHPALACATDLHPLQQHTSDHGLQQHVHYKKLLSISEAAMLCSKVAIVSTKQPVYHCTVHCNKGGHLYLPQAGQDA